MTNCVTCGRMHKGECKNITCAVCKKSHSGVCRYKQKQAVEETTGSSASASATEDTTTQHVSLEVEVAKLRRSLATARQQLLEANAKIIAQGQELSETHALNMQLHTMLFGECIVEEEDDEKVGDDEFDKDVEAFLNEVEEAALAVNAS